MLFIQNLFQFGIETKVTPGSSSQKPIVKTKEGVGKISVASLCGTIKFQMRSCMGRSDLACGASGMWKKSGKMLCKLVISSSKENNRLTLTS